MKHHSNYFSSDLTSNQKAAFAAAIQAGAISESQLKKILNNTDTKRIRELATPRTSTTLSSVQQSRIRALNASNYSLSEIANKLGVSTSTVSKYLKGVN